jgi:hypothetical protein
MLVHALSENFMLLYILLLLSTVDGGVSRCICICICMLCTHCYILSLLQLAAQMIMEAVPESDEPDDGDNDDTSQPPSDSDRSKYYSTIISVHCKVS